MKLGHVLRSEPPCITANHHGWLGIKTQLPICPQVSIRGDLNEDRVLEKPTGKCKKTYVTTKQCCKHIILVDIHKLRYCKASHSFRITCNKRKASLLQSEEQGYVKAITVIALDFFLNWCGFYDSKYKVSKVVHRKRSDKHCNRSDTRLSILLLELYY